jgi:hypothetical protein
MLCIGHTLAFRAMSLLVFELLPSFNQVHFLSSTLVD